MKRGVALFVLSILLISAASFALAQETAGRGKISLSEEEKSELKDSLSDTEILTANSKEECIDKHADRLGIEDYLRNSEWIEVDFNENNGQCIIKYVKIILEGNEGYNYFDLKIPGIEPVSTREGEHAQIEFINGSLKVSAESYFYYGEYIDIGKDYRETVKLKDYSDYALFKKSNKEPVYVTENEERYEEYRDEITGWWETAEEKKIADTRTSLKKESIKGVAEPNKPNAEVPEVTPERGLFDGIVNWWRVFREKYKSNRLQQAEELNK